jgi:hypothetical protein
MTGSAILPSFNGGEISPRLRGRVDQSVYGIALERMLGWLPTIEGAAVAAPGTHYVEAAAGPCRLFPFELRPTEGYVIEASNLKLRFYTNDVRLESPPGTAIEVVSPYSYADLLALDYHESADVLYLAGAGKQQRKLSRTGASAFTLAALDLANGPIGDGNSDTTKTIIASGTTGSVTLTASSALFAATDVGRLVELEAADFHDIPSWEPGLTVSVGDKRTWSGKVYQCAGGIGRTGQNPPIHDSGTEWDGSGAGTDVNAKGPYGATWTFLYGLYGLAKITAYTDSTHVTATILKRLADSLTATATWRWSFGAFSDTSGWPGAVCEWNECLCFAIGDRVYVSVVGDLENFERRDSSGDFQRDLAGTFRIPHGGTIQWMAADRLLLVGTDKGEYSVERIITQTGEAGPPIFDVRLQSSAGSAKVKPVQTDGRILLVQTAGRKLLEMAYAISGDRYDTPDKTRLARHIGQRGFAEIAWQKEPERTLWAAMADGTLAALAYNPDQQVMGWCRRELGGVAAGALEARSIASITDPAGKLQQLWIAAETPSGAWWVLRMAVLPDDEADEADDFYVDAGLSANDGSQHVTFAGLDHLDGETVDILADGKPHPPRVVAAGAISLDYPATKVVAGLPYEASLKTLRIEAGQAEGTAQGKLKRMVRVTLGLFESSGLRVSVQDLPDQIPLETMTADDPLDMAVPPFTGDFALDTIGSYESGGQVIVERWQPRRATLLGIVPVFEVGDAS